MIEPEPGDLRMDCASHSSRGPGQGGTHRRPFPRPLPSDKAQRFQLPRQNCPCTVLQAFQITHCLHCYAFVSQSAKPPDGDKQVSIPGVYISDTTRVPRVLFTPKQHRKEVIASSQQMQIPANLTAFDLETGARQAAGVRNKSCRGQRGLGKRGTASKA